MRFHVQSKRQWASPNTDCAIQYKAQQYGIKNGWALKSHMDTAHAGEFDPSCRACLEIKRKMEAA